ncbi:MAG: hypothetical protein LUG52_09325 [Clostridia bacterium]|nr:hypothetical protein [Clostridia bacterium]
MDKYSWIIRFERRDGTEEKELYFDDEDSAREKFSCYDEPENAEIYTQIELVRMDWYRRTEDVLDGISF